MKSELNFKDKNIWIAGGGKSGLAAAKLLKSAGAEVFLSDMGPLNNETKVELQKIGIEFEEWPQYTSIFSKSRTSCGVTGHSSRQGPLSTRSRPRNGCCQRN
jgi:UDP-N-acetylmuramoylalanine-D-glutamate ligase